MLLHIVNNCIGRRLHKLEKLVSDPYLLCLANTNMLKLNYTNKTDIHHI